jgi:hypothetical protein
MNKLKRFIRKPLVILFLIIGFLFGSCDHSYIDGLENIKEYTYSPVFAIPLINSSLAIDDIIDIENYDAIYIDEENLIWLVYKGRVLTVPANELFMIGNQSSVLSFEFNPGKSEHTQVIEHEFKFEPVNDEVLQSIKFLSGLFNIELDAPELQANGYAISNSFEILNSVGSSNNEPITGLVTPNEETQVNISGSTINFEYPDNFFTVRHTITITGEGNPAGAPYDVTVRQSVTNTRYEIVKGMMGTVAFPIGGTTVEMGLFENFDLENVFFEAPRVDVYAFNSFGSPIDLVFTDFFASNSSGQKVNLSGPGFQNPWRINTAVTEGEKSTTTAKLDRANSNMDDIAAIGPNEYFYSVYGVTNPDGPEMNFIRHDSSLNVDVEIFLPFWGRIQKLEVEELLENPMDSIPEEIDWIELNLNITNGFPLDAFIQIYFADEKEVKTDSLFANLDHTNFIKAAPVDGASGIVNTPEHKNTKIMIDQSKIVSLSNSPNLIIKTNLITYNQQVPQSVKILDNYRLDLQLGVRVKPKVIVDFEEEDD